MGRSKSAVYRALTRFGHVVIHLDLYPAARGFSGVLGLDEKWLRIPKSFQVEQRLAGKKWRYAHFAVDVITGDLLHVEVYNESNAKNTLAFLLALRAMGIRPHAVVTDMWAGYEDAIVTAFGERVVHHFCLFHHLQAVRRHLRDKFGKDWKRHPLLQELVKRLDSIYDCRERRTAKGRLAELLALRPQLQVAHPEALSLLDLIEKRFPKVINALDSRGIPTTNNATERVIKAFNQHYKTMAGLESLPTARVQLALFRFFYRLTPQRETERREDRGTCPLERAGFQVRGTPLGDYVRGVTEALVQPRQPAPRS